MAEKYSNTDTTSTITLNEVAKSLRLITKKTKENANKTISIRTSEKTGISETDVKDQRLLTTPEVEDKSNKNQQDIQSNQRLQTTPEVEDKSNKNQQDLQSNQRVQKKHVVEDKTNKNQQDVAQLLSNVHFYDVLTFLNGEIPDLEMKLQDQRVQKKHVVEDKTNKNQQDVAQLQSRIQYIEMKLQDIKLEYIELRSKISFIYSSNLIVDVGFKKRLHIDMYLAEDSTKYIERVKALVKKRLHTDMYDNKYMESVEALGKEFHAQIDEYIKCLFSAMLLIDNDEKTHQHFGKKEKMELKKLIIKKVKQLQSQLIKENQLIELENTELVVPLLKELYILKEREGDLQKEDELKEQVKTELLADNILCHRTKIRNANSKMNFSSVHRACYLYRKNIQPRMLVLLEQLIEALDSIKSPHYIWPSGHPLILSKERQIELYFSSNEYMERLHSFVNGRNRRHRTWNSDQIVRPEPMVSAGFSYDGEDDKVVCKSCGAISDVNDWSDDDEDYAFTMHRRTRSSHCEFLRKFDPWRSKM